jgi:hypothetical protein
VLPDRRREDIARAYLDRLVVGKRGQVLRYTIKSRELQ